MGKELAIITLILFVLFGLQNLFPREKFSSNAKDLKKDLTWFLINEVGMTFVIAKLTFFISSLTSVTLDRYLITINLNSLGFWFQLLAFVLILDFLSYWTHRLQHNTKLWEIHKLHHSIETLSPFSSYRHSLLENFYNSFIVIGITSLMKVDPQVRNIGILVFTYTCVFQHTNIKLPFSDTLSLLFITPNCHVTHHSKENHLKNGQNFGFIFSIWDRAFKTYQSKEYKDLEIGIKDSPFKDNIAKDFLYPLIKSK